MRIFCLISIAALLPPVFPAMASATLESGPNDAIQHKESGWLFPKKVGTLDRKDKPSAISGTDDVFAQYETGKGGEKIITTVYLYPAKSVALDSSYSGAQAAIEQRLRGPLSLAQLWSEGPFTVGKQRKLMGRKSFYKGSLGPNSVADSLYYYDTGRWIVKIRMTGPEAAKAYEVGDEFVRSLPWDSLNIVEDECTGYSCTVSRPIAIHGMIPEMLATLLTKQNALSVDEGGPNCTSAQIVESLAAKPKLSAEGLASPVEKIANCRAGGQDVGFVRFVLPRPVLEKLETAPDGLTLTGPFTFATIKRGNDIELAELHDGAMDTKAVDGVLDRINAKRQVVFSTLNLKDGKTTPVMRHLK